MKRDEEDRLRAQARKDANDPAAWEEVPQAESTTRRRGGLGAQVTLRLSPEYAERLRRIAGVRGLGYTSLLREWVEQRIRREEVSVRYSVESQSGYTTEHQRPTVTSSNPRVRDLVGA